MSPQLDTPADLASRINVKLQEMPKAEPVVQDALIKGAYDLLRAWCEAFVEQELLQSVTQRYRHNIKPSVAEYRRTGRRPRPRAAYITP